ncbi:MAG: hypothetical protein RH948_02225 [Cyclobacteriaceae bacterium]
MKLFKYLFFAMLISFFYGCSNIEDAEPTERKTFIHFYEKSIDYIGIASEPLDDGYLLAGNLELESEFSGVISRTDLFGNVIWEQIMPNSSVKSIKVVDDGYLVLGDSIQVDEDAAQVLDIIKTKSRLIKMSLDGNILTENNFFNKNNPSVDFHGDALSISPDGTIISIGNFQAAGATTKTFVAAHNPNTLDTLWTRSYSLIDRDYKNSKSGFVTSSGKIVWASAAEKSTQNNFKSYITVPSVDPNSTFVNSDSFGVTEDQFYDAADIVQSSLGFAIIGTYKNTQGQNSNMFFLRADPIGNIQEGSERFFDGFLSSDNSAIEKSASSTQDTGNAIAATSDGGYILAGSMTTSLDRGNGGQDILLIRVSPFGEILWNKVLGGSGDEVPNSIRVTSDGGYLICGSVSIGGLSSAFLIRTDRNGELND